MTDDLVTGDDVFVAATGVTTGALLRGVRYVRDGAITDSIVMRSRSGTGAPDRGAASIDQADAVHGKGVLMGIGLDELPGYDERLYILRSTIRGSFEKMVGECRAGGRREETLIWEGFQRAVELGAPKASAGVLSMGTAPTVAHEAKAGGYKLAMPVEKLGSERVRLRSTATSSARRSKSTTRTSPRCSSATTPRATAR